MACLLRPPVGHLDQITEALPMMALTLVALAVSPETLAQGGISLCFVLGLSGHNSNDHRAVLGGALLRGSQPYVVGARFRTPKELPICKALRGGVRRVRSSPFLHPPAMPWKPRVFAPFAP